MADLIIRRAFAGYQPASLDAMTRYGINQMTSTPSATRVAAIDAFCVALRAAGITSKLVSLKILAAHSQQAGFVDYVNSALTGSFVGATPPTFIPNQGTYSAGVAGSAFDTGVNVRSLITAGSLGINDFGVAVWNGVGSTGNPVNGIYDFAGNQYIRFTIDQSTPRILSVEMGSQSGGVNGSSLTWDATGARAHGMVALQRTNSTTVEDYTQGVLRDTLTQSAAANVPNGNFYLHAYNRVDGPQVISPNTSKYGIVAFFRALTAAQQLAFENAAIVYMKAIGNWKTPLRMWGDSLTEQGTNGAVPTINGWCHGVSWGGLTPSSTNIYRRVYNHGVSAERSDQIYARFQARSDIGDNLEGYYGGYNDIQTARTAATMYGVAQNFVADCVAGGKTWLMVNVHNGQYQSGLMDSGTANHTKVIDYNTLIESDWGPSGTIYPGRLIKMREAAVAAGSAGEIARDVPAKDWLNGLTSLPGNDPTQVAPYWDPVHWAAGGLSKYDGQYNLRDLVLANLSTRGI